MREKRPIDRKRESAGSFSIESGGVVTNMFPIGDSLHIVTKDSIHVIMLVDQINPGRTNVSVPNAQQRVLSHGSDSVLVGRVPLTAKHLFQPTVLSKSFDCGETLSLALEVLKDLAAMQDAAVAFAASDVGAGQIGGQAQEGQLGCPAIDGQCSAAV